MKYLNLEKTIITTLAAGAAISSFGAIKADAFGLGDVDFKVVNTETLNVRTEPNTKSPVKKVLKKGDIVTPVELNEAKTWARIGENEWVSLSYLQMMDDSTIPENGTEYEKLDGIPYIVNTDSLELRAEPSRKSEVVGSFTKGTKVFATKANGAWILIENGHTEGWVVKDFLKAYNNENTSINTNTNNNTNNNTTVKPSTSFKEETISTKKLKVSVFSANVRKAPSMDAEVVGYMQTGQTSLTNTVSGSWYKVEKGWIHNSCVTVVKNTTNNTTNNTTAKPSISFKEETIPTTDVEVTVSSSNVRKAPSMDAEVVGYMQNGQTSTTNTISGNWYKVEKGWIHKNCVKEVVGSMNSNFDDLVDMPAGDMDMSRTVNVSKGSNLLVRYTRALGGSIKYKLPAGTRVTLINDINGVSYIKYIDDKGYLQFGYVASQYLK